MLARRLASDTPSKPAHAQDLLAHWKEAGAVAGKIVVKASAGFRISIFGLTTLLHALCLATCRAKASIEANAGASIFLPSYHTTQLDAELKGKKPLKRDFPPAVSVALSPKVLISKSELLGFDLCIHVEVVSQNSHLTMACFEQIHLLMQTLMKSTKLSRLMASPCLMMNIEARIEEK